MRMAVDKVERIVLAQPVFLADRYLQRERVLTLWNLIDGAHLTHDLATAQMVAAKIDHIGQTLPEFRADRYLQHFRAQSKVAVAEAFCLTGAIEEAREAMENVEQLFKSYSDVELADINMQSPRIIGWFTIALCLIESGRLEEAHSATSFADDLAQYFQENQTLLSTRASAWKYIASACSKKGMVQETLKIAETMEGIATSRPDHLLNLDLQLARATIWGNVVAVYCKAGQLEQARTAAEKVEFVAQAQAVFRSEHAMQVQRAKSWAILAKALAEAGEREGLQEAASRVLKITQIAPMDAEMYAISREVAELSAP